jgi:hypothetical protein
MLQRTIEPLEVLRERIISEAAFAANAFTAGIIHAMNVGDALIAARGQLDHGQYLPFVKSCGLSPRLAQMYSRLARHRQEIEAKGETVSHMTIPRALALLAKPKTKDVSAPAPVYFTVRAAERFLQELDDLVALMREAFPDETDENLKSRASDWRHVFYCRGTWPTVDQVRGVPPNLESRAESDQDRWQRNEEEYFKQHSAKRKRRQKKGTVCHD